MKLLTIVNAICSIILAFYLAQLIADNKQLTQQVQDARQEAAQNTRDTNRDNQILRECGCLK